MPTMLAVIKNRYNLYFLFLFAAFLGAACAISVISSGYSHLIIIISSVALICLAIALARLVYAVEILSDKDSSRPYWKLLSKVCFGSNTDSEQQTQPNISEFFVPKIVEGVVTSRLQLGQALTDLMEIAFQHLPIKGIEVSLYDNSTSYYFFSLLMGAVPFEQRSRILELPLSFSGKVLGSVKYCAEESESFAEQHYEIARLLTLQVGVLFVNAEYSSELLRMQQSADESLRAKTGFLANLSHEVRAPLGVIVNATELVLDGMCGTISDDQRRILGLARNGSEHLLELLNDVLDYAKIEAGKLAPQRKDISVHEILKDVTTLIRFQAEQKKIEVIHKESVEALAVNVDRKHLRQILINLLTNAVKYTPENGKIEVWAERAAGQMIRLNVKDSGVGIDPSHRDKVFAPFERLNHSYSRQQAGVGLGLSLAKRLAELNGGSLDFESTLGEGSRFWAILKSTQIDILDKAEKPAEKSIRSNGEVVVLIDNDPDNLEILYKYLFELGYDLKSFATYEEAATVLENEKVQLLIMDNSELDDVNSKVGVAVSKLVEAKNVSVVLLSSRAFIFDLEKYLKLGVERCLPKPVPLKELALLCRQVIDSRNSELGINKLDNALEQGSADAESRPVINKDLLH